MNKLNILKRIAITLALLITFVVVIFVGDYICKATLLPIIESPAFTSMNNGEMAQYNNAKLRVTFEKFNSSATNKKTETKKTTANETKQKVGVHEYIGNFKITHYCICRKCCGKSPSHPNYGITATGTRATPGRTIAVDPRKIPYGTKVIIDGHTYIAEDCGGAIKGNKIDICVSSHSEALQKGVRKNVPVYIVKG